MALASDPVIHLYCLCWNEIRMIPFFLGHYVGVVDRFFVLDNGSTDGSVELLQSNPRVDVRQFEVEGDSLIETARLISENAWKASRGKADWVIVVDMDEHLFHPDLRGYLRRCSECGITMVPAKGYDMITDRFPESDQPLWRTVPTGYRAADSMDKICIFNPIAVEGLNFLAGRHWCEPEGHIAWPKLSEVKLLHYKRLGLDYLQTRTRELATGLRDGDASRGLSRHWEIGDETIRDHFQDKMKIAAVVPGLGPALRQADLDLRIAVDGDIIRPERAQDGRYVFPLPPNAREVILLSAPLDAKTPLIGVPVQEIVLRRGAERTEISLDDPALEYGWWAVAQTDGGPQRCTDCSAVLQLDGDGNDAIEIKLADPDVPWSGARSPAVEVANLRSAVASWFDRYDADAESDGLNVCLEIGGEFVNPIYSDRLRWNAAPPLSTLEGWNYAFALPLGTTDLKILTWRSENQRTFHGAPIARLVQRQSGSVHYMALNDEGLGHGWFAATRIGYDHLRWTSGVAQLILDFPAETGCIFEVAVAHPMIEA